MPSVCRLCPRPYTDASGRVRPTVYPACVATRPWTLPAPARCRRAAADRRVVPVVVTSSINNTVGRRGSVRAGRRRGPTRRPARSRRVWARSRRPRRSNRQAGRSSRWAIARASNSLWSYPRARRPIGDAGHQVTTSAGAASSAIASASTVTAAVRSPYLSCRTHSAGTPRWGHTARSDPSSAPLSPDSTTTRT